MATAAARDCARWLTVVVPPSPLATAPLSLLFLGCWPFSLAAVSMNCQMAIIFRDLPDEFENKWLEGVFDTEMLTNFQMPENVWDAIPMPKNSKDWGQAPLCNQMSLFD